ncbi:MAG: TauD/TfdA dioxygenase family protein, partial [Reyranella sp.]
MAEVVPLKAPLGARIEGLERGQANEPAIAALLNRALAEHLLVVIPGDPMTPEATLGFARAFGKPRTQLLRYKHSGETPEVSIMVSTLKTDGTTDKTAIRAEDWHTDDSYFAIPAKATLLHGIEIPSRGGATWFCNMHSVYEALPETLRRRIDGLRSIHGYDTPRARNRPSARTPQEIAETPDVE